MTQGKQHQTSIESSDAIQSIHADCALSDLSAEGEASSKKEVCVMSNRFYAFRNLRRVVREMAAWQKCSWQARPRNDRQERRNLIRQNWLSARRFHA